MWYNNRLLGRKGKEMKKILVGISAFYVAFAAFADVIVMKSGAK